MVPTRNSKVYDKQGSDELCINTLDWARETESRVHVRSSETSLPLLSRARASLLAIQAQRLLLTIYRQGREPAVFLDLHSFLTVLDDSLRGDFPAIDYFSGR